MSTSFLPNEREAAEGGGKANDLETAVQKLSAIVPLVVGEDGLCGCDGAAGRRTPGECRQESSNLWTRWAREIASTQAFCMSTCKAAT